MISFLSLYILLFFTLLWHSLTKNNSRSLPSPSSGKISPHPDPSKTSKFKPLHSNYSRCASRKNQNRPPSFTSKTAKKPIMRNSILTNNNKTGTKKHPNEDIRTSGILQLIEDQCSPNWTILIERIPILTQPNKTQTFLMIFLSFNPKMIFISSQKTTLLKLISQPQ